MEQSTYYTPAMRRAFNSLTAPAGFVVTVVEHNIEGMGFLELVADEKQFFSLSDFEKRRAVEYLVKAKNALEDNGAMVQITRRAVE